MAAHLFVVPGTLDHLHCDDVIASTDARGVSGVRSQWWPALGWRNERDLHPWADVRLDDRRFLPLDPDGRRDGPARWLVDVASRAAVEGTGWLRDGVRQVLRAVADSGPALSGRPRRVAIPVVGVGGGGLGHRRGAVVAELLDELADAPDSLDVVVVAASRSDYSAIQARRRVLGWGALGDEQLDTTARTLAAQAASGRLAVFMGAGTGVAAGLPTWAGLLTALAERLAVPGGADAFAGMSPLDAAEVLRRSAEAEPTSGGRGGPAASLGVHVAEVLGTPQRYALSHVLLAALGAEQVITTNFDDLYERAVRAVTGRDIPVVLPDGSPTGDLRHGRGWLLKLHGDARRPESIVLDRRSFVRYDAMQRPLASVLQATLLTKHLLVVGASMTDDNVIRLVHEVASLNEDRGRSRTMGTLLTLEDQPLTARLWKPEFTTVTVGPAAPAEESADERRARMVGAGRRLEVLLDRVAMLAARDPGHLLDRRYADLLDADEQSVAQQLADSADAIRRLAGTSRRSGEWHEVLARLEQWGAAGR